LLPEHSLITSISTDEAMPVVDVVSDGLWVVMQKLSQKYKLRMATEKEVLDKMTKLVDDMLIFGFYATYGENMAQAALDFQKNVLQRVEQDIKKQPLNKPLNAQDLWQVASAQFFAKLINNARERVAQRIQIYKLLPTRIGKLPQDTTLGSITIDTQWINSQIIAAVLENEVDYVTSKDLAAAFPIISTMNDLDLRKKSFQDGKNAG
jgi:hypothetical protein